MPTSKKGPFDLKKNTSSKPTERKVKIKLDNSADAIAQRKTARHSYELESVSLLIDVETAANRSDSRKRFQYNFSSLAQTYPHHLELIKQFVLSFHMMWARRKQTFTTAQTRRFGIEEFILFLNSDEPNAKPAHCFADINFGHGLGLKSWQLRHKPGRTNNRKAYTATKALVGELQSIHASNERVGTPFSWPEGPKSTEKPTEGYSISLYNGMVNACLSDMKLVKKEMSGFATRLKNYDPFPEDLDRRSQDWRDRETTKSATDLQMRALSTIYHHHQDWPFNTDLDDAINRISSLKSHLLPKGDRVAYTMLYRYRFGPIENPIAIGQLAYLAHFAFTSQSLYPFFLWVQLQTGWNQEGIFSLSDNLDEHCEPDPLDKNFVMIYATKGKTQDTLSHRSNIKEPFGVYQILRFVAEKVVAHKSSHFYIPGHLWQFVISKNLWGIDGVTTVFSVIDLTTINTTSRSFLKRHGLTSESVSTQSRKIRTTVETLRRRSGLSIQTTSELMGHKEVDTTINSYDSDTASNMLKSEKLRSIQDRYIQDFKSYGLRLSESITLQELRETTHKQSTQRASKVTKQLDITESQVIHILSPEGQTYIAACLDSANPTWPEHEKHLNQGDRCKFFNRCAMCNKSMFFLESLPFVARRIIDLENLKLSMTIGEWTSNYGLEMEGWAWVLDSWNNKEQVAEAKEKCSRPEYVLPLIFIGA